MSIEDPIDRDVFILGAGFSKGLRPESPLMAGFLAGHLDLLTDTEFRPAAEFIQRCGMEPAALNIETLLTLATISKPWQSSLDGTKDAHAAESIRRLISEVIFKAFPQKHLGGNLWTIELEDDKRAALANFADYLLRVDTSHVITFNYDPLLENAIGLHDREISIEEYARDSTTALHRTPRFDIAYS